MWYFSWVLGVGLACVFAILNAMWFEMKEDRRLSALPDLADEASKVPAKEAAA
jgi:cyd operon protein YbgT